MDQPLRPVDPAQTALRASDMDRERVATVLRENYSAGRLNLDEFQERLEKAYASKTLGELDVLTRDLPAERAAASPVAPQMTSARSRGKQVRDRVLTYVILMAFLVAVWAATGAHGSFWPIWPIIVGAFILAFDLLGLERRETRRQERTALRAERRAERRERRRSR